MFIFDSQCIDIKKQQANNGEKISRDYRKMSNGSKKIVGGILKWRENPIVKK